MPLMTRLYSPEAFAELGLFMVYVGALSAIGTLKLDQALLLPEKDEDASRLVMMSSTSLVFTVAVISVGLVVWSEWSGWEVCMIALASFSAGLALLFIQWANRMGFTRAIAWHKLSLGAGVSGAQIGSYGLEGGLLIGKVIGDYIALIPYSQVLLPLVKGIKDRFKWELFKKYARFPLLLMPVTAFAYVGNRFPLIVFNEYGLVSEGGEFEAVYRLSMAAATLVVSSLYLGFSEAMIQKIKQGESVSDFFNTHIRTMAFTILLPAIPVIGLTTWLLPDVLGEAWGQTGLFFLVLSPLFLAYIMVSPFVYVFLYQNKMSYMVGFEFLIHVLKLIGLFWGLSYSVLGGLIAFSVVGTAVYAVYGWYVYRSIRAL